MEANVNKGDNLGAPRDRLATKMGKSLCWQWIALGLLLAMASVASSQPVAEHATPDAPPTMYKTTSGEEGIAGGAQVLDARGNQINSIASPVTSGTREKASKVVRMQDLLAERAARRAAAASAGGGGAPPQKLPQKTKISFKASY